MKPYDSDEELERALFALDLEEPPADLRASILAGTVYRVPLAATVRPWEVWLYGALCALLAWMLILVAHGSARGALEAANAYGAQALSLLAQPAVLFWTAVGGAAAAWISQMNLSELPGFAPFRRR
jgi:hypothetical protein